MVQVVSFEKRLPPAAARASRGTLAEMMAKAKAASEARNQAMEIETPTIMQGIGKVAQSLSSGLQERWANQEATAGREELAQIRAQIDPLKGATPEQEARMSVLDPDLADRFRSEAIQARRDEAARQEAIANREDQQAFTAGESAAQRALTASEGAAGREVTTSEGAASRALTASEGQAGRDVTTGEGAASRAVTQGEGAATRANQVELQEGRIAADAKAAQILAEAPDSPSAKIIADYHRGNYKGREQDFNADLAKAQQLTGPSTVIDMGNATPKLWEEFDKKIGANFASYLDDAATAGTQVRGLEIIDQINPNEQGPLVGRLAQMFPGVSSQAALFESIVNKMAPRERVEGSGSTSDIEYKGMLRSWPSIINMPGANKAISAAIRAQAQIAMARADIVTKMRTGQMEMEAGYRAFAELNQRSILTPELKDAIAAFDADNPEAPAVVDPDEERILKKWG